MINEWYYYFVKLIKGGVEVISLLRVEEAVKRLLVIGIFSLVLISVLLVVPPVSAELKPLSPHVCGSAVGSHVFQSAGNVFHGNWVLPNAGDAPCNGYCQATGDYCYRCEGACLNHPGLVSQLIGTEKICLDAGILVRTCCDPWTTYCVFHCME